MDPIVRSAMAKWPDVPDLFGWLSLDARGQWSLRGDVIRHAGLIDFIARNYQADESGRWHFQNGPQRVFVTLACTPWIARLRSDGRFETHTGRALSAHACLIDENGQLILASDAGPALIDDRDLLAVTNRIVTDQGEPADAHALIEADGQIEGLRLQLPAARIPFERIHRADLPARFNFDPAPDQPRP
jgi:hypothetical protein